MFNISTQKTQQNYRRSYTFFTVCFLFFLFIWITSFSLTDDRINWLIENLLVIIFIPILYLIQFKFKFSKLAFLFILLFMSLHVVGSMYAYASVPFGFELQHYFHLKRNPYDRIVHFSFGLLMSFPIHEMLKKQFKAKGWKAFILPIEIVLSLSAVFELIEWFIGGVLMPSSEKTYVGSQGDIWDAQKDMALAWLGAIIMMLITYMIDNSRKGKINSTNNNSAKPSAPSLD